MLMKYRSSSPGRHGVRVGLGFPISSSVKPSGFFAARWFLTIFLASFSEVAMRSR
jgi:hypothetical protein